MEIQTGCVAGGADNPGGVIADAAGMQQLQRTLLQSPLTPMRVNQFSGDQIERHRIDAEIAPHQIRLKGAGLNDGILPGGGIGLPASRRQIQEHTIQTELDGAETAVLPAGGEALRAADSLQCKGELAGIPFHHEIEIRNSAPGHTVAPMQQSVAHDPSDEGEMSAAELPGSSPESIQQSIRHTRQVHGAACRTMHRSSRIRHLSALTRCLQEEATAIASAAERLSSEQVEAALTLLERCADRKAKLVITGVGKSGIVARKIAATFSSIGLMALFLNPLDALHGDLGVVAPEDVCLLLSNSGETAELLEVLPHLKRRGTGRIAIVGRAESSLARGSDVVLEAGVDREVCPLNLAPTASTAVAMAIGDALAAVWMARRGISPADFALNHPAGSLGKQLTLTAADLMVPASKLHALKPETPLPEVIGGLTRDGIGCGWVERSDQSGALVGIITDGDLRRALQDHSTEGWSRLTAADLMTADPITVEGDVLVVHALECMERNRRKPISVLPVVNSDQEMQGLLRLHDLVQAGLA